jgi:hypothetical protein
MDELIAELEGRRGLFQSKAEADRLNRTLSALSAYAEREKELVEALKEIALLSNNNRANKKMLGDKARAILAKLKEQP